MIAFEIQCNLFTVLPFRLKTGRSNYFFFLFSKAKCVRPKNQARLKGFARLNAPGRVRSASGAQFVQAWINTIWGQT